MRKLNRIDDLLFRDLLRARLDHHNAVLRADDHDVQRALRALGIRRIHDELIIHNPDPHRAHRPMERNIAQRQRAARAVDAQHIRIIFLVRRVHKRNHLRLIPERLRKQRTNRPVNLTARQNLLLARPSFTLDKSAGNASTRIGELAILHRQREKIDALFRVRRSHSRRQNYIVATRSQRCAGGLLGHAPGLKFNLLAAGKLNCHVLFHVASLLSSSSRLSLCIASSVERARKSAALAVQLLAPPENCADRYRVGSCTHPNHSHEPHREDHAIRLSSSATPAARSYLTLHERCSRHESGPCVLP